MSSTPANFIYCVPLNGQLVTVRPKNNKKPFNEFVFDIRNNSNPTEGGTVIAPTINIFNIYNPPQSDRFTDNQLSQNPQQPPVERINRILRPTIYSNENNSKNKLLPSIYEILPNLKTLEIYNEAMRFSEELVYYYYGNNFSFIPKESIFSNTLTHDDITENSRNILSYLDNLLSIVKDQCKFCQDHHKLIEGYIKTRDPLKAINTMNIQDILFLFGIYVTDTGIIGDINYQVDTNNEQERIPSSSLARACFFSLPIESIETFFANSRSIDSNLYNLIPKYTHGRVDLLRLLTQGENQPLNNSLIINSIIEERAWDLLNLALTLGAKPVLTDNDPNQTLRVIRNTCINMNLVDTNRFFDFIYQKFALSISEVANQKALTSDEKLFWKYFIEGVASLKRT